MELKDAAYYGNSVSIESLGNVFIIAITVISPILLVLLVIYIIRRINFHLNRKKALKVKSNTLENGKIDTSAKTSSTASSKLTEYERQQALKSGLRPIDKIYQDDRKLNEMLGEIEPVHSNKSDSLVLEFDTHGKIKPRQLEKMERHS